VQVEWVLSKTVVYIRKRKRNKRKIISKGGRK
jgi:hypothetical protein